MGNQQIGRHPTVRLRDVGNEAAGIRAAVHFLVDLDIERPAPFRPGQRPHDLLHGLQESGALGFPSIPRGWRGGKTQAIKFKNYGHSTETAKIGMTIQ